MSAKSLARAIHPEAIEVRGEDFASPGFVVPGPADRWWTTPWIDKTLAALAVLPFVYPLAKHFGQRKQELVVSSFGVPSYYATFVVNVAGCTVAGCLLGLTVHVWSPSETMRLFVFVGIMGGFTTFSAFSTDAILLI